LARRFGRALLAAGGQARRGGGEDAEREDHAFQRYLSLAAVTASGSRAGAVPPKLVRLSTDD
jgi:hypothetical protein